MQTTNPPPPPSSHERMLQAAVRLFSQQGFAHTSTAQVAREAGTSESQLIKHFGSKEGLLDAIFEQAWRELNAEVATLVAGADSPAGAIRTLMRFMLARLDKQPQVKRLMLFEGRRMRAHGLAVTSGFRHFVDRLDSLLRQARRTGALRLNLPIAAIRSALIATAEGLLRDRILSVESGYPASYSARDITRAMDAVIDTFIARPGRRVPGE